MPTKVMFCKNCGMPIDEPRKEIPKVGIFETGKLTYLKILDGLFKSIELCPFCYSAMRSYRHTLSKEERNFKEKK